MPGQEQTNYLSDDQVRRPKHLIAGRCASGYLQTKNADEVDDPGENAAQSIYQNPHDDWPRLEPTGTRFEPGLVARRWRLGRRRPPGDLTRLIDDKCRDRSTETIGSRFVRSCSEYSFRQEPLRT